jgi:transcriptional regulator with XRE-family HTH domain
MPVPVTESIIYPEGVEIKIARIRAGLRQYEVATSVGILPNRLSEIEAGRRRPSPELLERILQVIEGNNDGQTEREN